MPTDISKSAVLSNQHLHWLHKQSPTCLCGQLCRPCLSSGFPWLEVRAYWSNRCRQALTCFVILHGWLLNYMYIFKRFLMRWNKTLHFKQKHSNDQFCKQHIVIFQLHTFSKPKVNSTMKFTRTHWQRCFMGNLSNSFPLFTRYRYAFQHLGCFLSDQLISLLLMRAYRYQKLHKNKDNHLRHNCNQKRDERFF